MKSLDQIAIECGTDKSSLGHSYCQYYDSIFSHLRKAPINLLEIGIDKGDSLRMWNEYFEIGVIHGIDIRDGYEYLHNGIIITHVVDQSIYGELIIFAEQYRDYFDIIIDDGSHMSSDMINTFKTLFPYLKSGGYYVIEDLLCDYDHRWNKGESIIEYMKKLVDSVNMDGAIPNEHICANKKEAVKKYTGTYWDNNIEWTFNACGTTIIKKI